MSGRSGGRSARNQLAELYASLPAVECKGLCQDGCGSVAMTRLEQQQIRVRHGVTLPLIGAFAAYGKRCPALNAEGRCSVYADRPFICRLYGAAETLRCPFGCEPADGVMSERDARLAMARLEELSGNTARADALRRMYEHEHDDGPRE